MWMKSEQQQRYSNHSIAFSLASITFENHTSFNPQQSRCSHVCSFMLTSSPAKVFIFKSIISTHDLLDIKRQTNAGSYCRSIGRQPLQLQNPNNLLKANNCSARILPTLSKSFKTDKQTKDTTNIYLDLSSTLFEVCDADTPLGYQDICFNLR